MFDSRVCARVRTDDIPTVSVEALRNLRTLLDAQTTLKMESAYPAELQGGEDAEDKSACTEFRRRVGVETASGAGERRVHSGAELTAKTDLGGQSEEGDRR